MGSGYFTDLLWLSLVSKYPLHPELWFSLQGIFVFQYKP